MEEIHFNQQVGEEVPIPDIGLDLPQLELDLTDFQEIETEEDRSLEAFSQKIVAKLEVLPNLQTKTTFLSRLLKAVMLERRVRN